ncbi:MAG: DNA repair protein RecO [Bacteroidales bacterium]|jgi:DNA repair protein RecO (recombination protein O)
MLSKTRGIVLNYFKYAESSIIVKIYTENFGLQSFIIRSSRSKKSKIKVGVFQPLTLLEFVTEHKKKSKLHTIKEITHCIQFSGISSDIRKSSIAIFITEILNKSIREEEQNKALFDFLFNTIQFLDKKERRISEFHLYFLIDLTKFLGFYPQDNYGENRSIFNLYNGKFQEHLPEHSYYIEKELSKYLHEIIAISNTDRDNYHIIAGIKKELINKLIDYYRIHLNGFSIVRSHAVLEDIFL